MSASLFISNRQRAQKVNVRQLRWMLRALLRDWLWIEDYDLAIYLVAAPRMAEINQAHLHHEGSTDVITFDYGDAAQARIGKDRRPRLPSSLHGELFICIDEAVEQARRFRTSWQSELARYAIHGILHLCGYDDLDPAARRVMKREENRLLAKVAAVFPLRKLAAKPKLTP